MVNKTCVSTSLLCGILARNGNTPFERAINRNSTTQGDRIKFNGSLAELGRLVHTLVTLWSDLCGKSATQPATLSSLARKLREIAQWTGGSGEVAPSVQRKKSKSGQIASMRTLMSPPTRKYQNFLRKAWRAEVVIFDCDLTPSQLRIYSQLPRARLFWIAPRNHRDLFASRPNARGSPAIEIARLNYLAPRIRETGGAKIVRVEGSVAKEPARARKNWIVAIFVIA